MLDGDTIRAMSQLRDGEVDGVTAVAFPWLHRDRPDLSFGCLEEGVTANIGLRAGPPRFIYAVWKGGHNHKVIVLDQGAGVEFGSIAWPNRMRST